MGGWCTVTCDYALSGIEQLSITIRHSCTSADGLVYKAQRIEVWPSESRAAKPSLYGGFPRATQKKRNNKICCGACYGCWKKINSCWNTKLTAEIQIIFVVVFNNFCGHTLFSLLSLQIIVCCRHKSLQLQQQVLASAPTFHAAANVLWSINLFMQHYRVICCCIFGLLQLPILASQGLSTRWHRVLRPWLARMAAAITVTYLHLHKAKHVLCGNIICCRVRVFCRTFLRQ